MSQISFPQSRTAPERNPGRLREIHKQRRFASLRAISALVLREMANSYGRSPGGYFWAIAEPVGGIILLTVIFSMGFRTPPMGTNFAIFYATGVIPFSCFLTISGKLGQSIKSSRALLDYPAVTFMDALLARIAFNTITHVMVSTIVFTGIYTFLDTRTDPQVLGIALGMVMAITFASAIGVMNCFMFEAFSWWQPLWGILMRPLFLLSCVFFMFDDIPQPYQNWLWFNPLVHVVGQMRRSFYPSYVGEYVSHLYVFGLSLGLLAFGLMLLIRYHRDLQNS